MGKHIKGGKPIPGNSISPNKGSRLSRACPICGARPQQKCFKTGKANYGEILNRQHSER